jgi:hypothetical protein
MLTVKPRKAPKTSSKGAAALKALESATSVSERLSIIWGLDSRGLEFPELDQAQLHRSWMWRRELLLDVANLHDDGFDWFYRKWARRFFRGKNIPSKPDVIKVRNELRQVWAPTIEHKQNQRIVSGWFHWRPASPTGQLEDTSGKIANVAMWEPVLKTGNIVPVVGSLHAQLVQGVLEQYGRFAICDNPDCPAGFFLSKRSDQKYCERGECTGYAQRLYALKWWNREGKASRKRKAGRKTGSKKGGSR